MQLVKRLSLGFVSSIVLVGFLTSNSNDGAVQASSKRNPALQVAEHGEPAYRPIASVTKLNPALLVAERGEPAYRPIA
jgi:hypothetical protein